MITKEDITIMNAEINSRIYQMEMRLQQLKYNLQDFIIGGWNTDTISNNIKVLEKEISSLKDIQIDANIRYNEQFIVGEMSSIKAYTEEKRKLEKRVK